MCANKKHKTCKPNCHKMTNGSLVMELTHLFISNAGACALWHWALVAPSSWLVSWHGVLLVPAFLLGWRFHGLLCGATKVWPLLLGTCGMLMVCPIGQGRHRHGSLLHGHQPGPFSLVPLWQVGLDLGSKGLPTFNASWSVQT